MEHILSDNGLQYCVLPVMAGSLCALTGKAIGAQYMLAYCRESSLLMPHRWSEYTNALTSAKHFLTARHLYGSHQVVEHALGHLPFMERVVITPTGEQYVGVDFAKKLCGVSIIRSGESMENALRACCKGIKIGKILIHR